MKKEDSDKIQAQVFAYLKTLTIAGGTLLVSFSFAGYSLMTTYGDIERTEIALEQVKTPLEEQNQVAIYLTPQSVLTEKYLNIDELKATAVSIEDAKEVGKSLIQTEPEKVAEQMTAQELAFKEPDYKDTSVVVEPSSEKSALIDVFPIGYGSFRIMISSEFAQQFKVTLTDSKAEEIIAQDYEVEEGENAFVLNSGSIPRGHYVLVVSNGITSCEKRVVLK